MSQKNLAHQFCVTLHSPSNSLYAPDGGKQMARTGYGEKPSPNLYSLTPEQREAAIKRAGEAMERAYSDYLRTNEFSDLGRAHHHLLQMRQLINGRSPETVAQMEAERGLD